jgi:hypothetical protein
MSFVKMLLLQTRDLHLLSTYAQPVIPVKTELCPPLLWIHSHKLIVRVCVAIKRSCAGMMSSVHLLDITTAKQVNLRKQSHS